jgi:cytochrome c2
MAAEGNWTVASLAAWLTDTDRFAPNTTMKYNNELTATEIQELSEWLMAQP